MKKIRFLTALLVTFSLLFFPSLVLAETKIGENPTGPSVEEIYVNKTQAVADGKDAINIRVFVFYSGGKTLEIFPVSGVKVYLEVSGSGNILNTSVVTTDAKGNARFTLKSTFAQTKTISATLKYFPGIPIPITAKGNVTFTIPPLSSSDSQVKVSKSQAIADGKDKINFTITVKDTAGNIKTSQTPFVSISGKGNSLSKVTQSGSNFICSLTSSYPEVKTVTIKAGGITLKTLKVTFIPQAPQLDKMVIGGREIAKENISEMEITTEDKISFSGSTIPKAEVTLYLQSEPKEYKTTSDGQGNWSYTLEEPLEEGEHTLQVAVTDPKTGKQSPKSEPVTFKIIAKAKPLETPKPQPNYLLYAILAGILLILGLIGYLIWKKKFSFRSFKIKRKE